MKSLDERPFRTKVSMILYFLQGSKRYFALAIVCVCLLVLFELVDPKIMSYTVDFVVGDEDAIPLFVREWVQELGGRAFVLQHLWIFSAVVIGIALLGALSRYLFRLFNAMGAEHLVKRMRDTLYSQIIHLPYRWQDQNKTGDIIQRCTSDVDMIKNFLSEQMTNLFRMIVMIVLSVLFMFRIHMVLALIAATFIPVVVCYSLFFHRKIGDSFLKVDAEEGRLSSIAQENLTGVRVVRAFGRERYERDRFEKKNEIYTGLWVKMMHILASFWVTNDVICGVQVLLLLSLGAMYTIGGEMSAGEYVAFMAYNGLLTFPVRQLGRVVAEMSKAGVSIDRIRYIMNSRTEQDAPDAVGFPGSGDIVFSHVNFSYAEGEDVSEEAQQKRFGEWKPQEPDDKEDAVWDRIMADAKQRASGEEESGGEGRREGAGKEQEKGALQSTSGKEESGGEGRREGAGKEQEKGALKSASGEEPSEGEFGAESDRMNRGVDKKQMECAIDESSESFEENALRMERKERAGYARGESESFEENAFRMKHGAGCEEESQGAVIRDLSLTIRKGQTVGILGGTGSGKSTLIQLLDGLYELQDSREAGEITINGVDIRRIRKQELRRHIGIVLQEPYLFSRTLEENIRIARDGADHGDVEHVVETASLTESVDRFTDGYETSVGERGVTLSGGQKQRTAIAQMLIRKPEIMIFDDSLSAVDAKTDARIRQGLREISSEATCILISHRITTIMQADQIFVMDDGRIVEQGTHEELMALGGRYNRIFQLQGAGAQKFSGEPRTPGTEEYPGEPESPGAEEQSGEPGAEEYPVEQESPGAEEQLGEPGAEEYPVEQESPGAEEQLGEPGAEEYPGEQESPGAEEQSGEPGAEEYPGEPESPGAEEQSGEPGAPGAEE